MKIEETKNPDGTIELVVDATPEEVGRAFDDAIGAFARQMNLRPEKGKTVSQLAQEQLGVSNLDAVVEPVAVENLVPHALDQRNIMPAFMPTARPRQQLSRGKRFSFATTVTPKPAYELSSYDPVQVHVPEFSFDDALVDQQISFMAEQYVTYEAAPAHPVRAHDTCLIALETFQDGKPVKGLSATRRSYTAGEGFMPDSFDENLIGMEVGETKTFTFEGPDFDEQGNPITVEMTTTVTVIEQQQQVKPTIDDEWVRANMPMYKDLADLRATFERDLSRQSRQQYQQFCRQAAVQKLAERFEGSIPDEVYEFMSQQLMADLRSQVASQGMAWEDFVNQQGGDQQVSMMIMMQTRQTLIEGYALDAVYRHEGLVASEDDIREVCLTMNPQDPQATRDNMERAGRGFALREAAQRLCASKWVDEHAVYTH